MAIPTTPNTTTNTPAADAFLFDAFISYRHIQPDRKWAKWLHTMLETYRVPKRLVEKGVRPKIGRVFRDEEELSASSNLSREIQTALERSRWLIVICSPRTPASEWVNQEILRFRQMGRGEQILALLVDGEPRESFPKALREIRRTVVDAAGKTVEELEQIEPLAADVRKGVHGGGHGRQMAGLRILAQVLGVRFDDLRQREQERRSRRAALLAAGAAVLAVGMAGLAVNAHLQRKEADKQRGIAETQTHIAHLAHNEAESRRVEAETREARGLVLQGDLLMNAGKTVEGRASYVQSIQISRRLGSSPFEAELGLFNALPQVVTSIDQWTSDSPKTENGLSACAVSPDGLSVLFGGFDKHIRLYDPVAGRVLRTFDGHTGQPTAIRFSPDGSRALSAGKDGKLFVWDIASGSTRPLHAMVAPDAPPDKPAITGAEFIEDGRRILTVHADSKLRAWDVATGRLLRTVAGRDMVSLAVTADGRTAITGGYEHITQWDLTGNALPALTPLQVPTSQPTTVPAPADDAPSIVEVRSTHIDHLFATAIGVSPDGDRAAYGGVLHLSGTLWDMAAWKPGVELTGHTDAVNSLQFCPDRFSILTTSNDHTMRLWDIAGHPMRTFAGHEQWVAAAALSADGKLAATASFDGTGRIWRVAPDPSRRVFHVENETLMASALSPDGTIAAFGGVKALYLFDVATRKRLLRLGGPAITPFCTGLAFTPDGKSLLSTGLDRVVRRRDLADGKLTELGRHGNTTATTRDVRNVVAQSGCLAMSPDGSTAITGSEDGRLLLWDLASNTLKHTFQVPKERVYALAFTPDGRTVVAAQFTRLLVLDVPGRTIRRTIEGKSMGAVSAAICPDGKTLITGHLDKDVHVWDLEAGVETKSLPGHSARLEQVSASPDGSLAFSISNDGTMRVWQLPDGRELRSFDMPLGKPASVTSATAPPRAGITPGGSVALTGCDSGFATLWDFTFPRAQYELRQKFTAARQSLAINPNDAKSLAIVAHWYWLTGAERLAAAAFERARAAGAPDGPAVDAVDPLLLGRALWLLDRREDAQKEFARAAELKLAPPHYIDLCRRAMARETLMAAPTTQPTTRSATRPTSTRGE